MAIKARKQRGCCKIALDGELTIYQAGELHEVVNKQLASCNCLDINMRSVTEIDTAAIQVLLALKRAALAAGKTITLRMHSDCVIEAFELMNVAHEFGDPVLISNRAQDATG